MSPMLRQICRLAPYVALAGLGIAGLNTTIMIVIAVVLMTGTFRDRSCLPTRRA